MEYVLVSKARALSMITSSCMVYWCSDFSEGEECKLLAAFNLLTVP